LVPTLIWVFTQIVMSGMSLDGAAMAMPGPASGASNSGLAPFVMRADEVGRMTAPMVTAGDQSGTGGHAHHKCSWCAQYAGIGPVGNVVERLRRPKNIRLMKLWDAGRTIEPKRLTAADFHSRAPPFIFNA